MEQLLFYDESSEYFGGGPVLHQLPPMPVPGGDTQAAYVLLLERHNAILHNTCKRQAEEIERLLGYVQQLTAALEDK